MIAVLLVSAVPSSAFYILSGLTVAAIGAGPLFSWLATAPALKRITVATLLAVGVGALVIVGRSYTRFHGMEIISCDFSWDMEILCWLFGIGG